MAKEKDPDSFLEIEEFLKLSQKGFLVIQGPREVGKTALLKKNFSKRGARYYWESGNNFQIQQLFRFQNGAKFFQRWQGQELLILEEAQKIPRLKEGLEIILRQQSQLKIILSSCWDLGLPKESPEVPKKLPQFSGDLRDSHQSEGKIWEERGTTFNLLPLSQVQLNQKYTRDQLRELLPWFLILGTYPQVVTASKKSQIESFLQELVFSKLLPEVVNHGEVKKPQKLLQLLKRVAFRVGQESSLNELAEEVDLDVKTVDRYLELLEKAFIVKKLPPFSRHLKKEIDSKAKYYFYDTGVRNAVISQFNELENRNDGAGLWENFLVMEKIKMAQNKQKKANFYFWRTYDGQAVDLVEEDGDSGNLNGYQFQWSRKDRKKAKMPQDWLRNYPVKDFGVVDRGNYWEFVDLS